MARSDFDPEAMGSRPIAFDPQLGPEGLRGRAKALREVVAEWLKSHPAQGTDAMADCGALLALAAEAAIASGGTEEDFLFVAQHKYRQELASVPASTQGTPGVSQ